MKKLLLTLTLAVAALAVHAQKKVYIPDEWKYNTSIYKESDPDNTAQYSKSRSRETDNFIVYWEKGYGNKAPDELSSSNFYYVNISDLLSKAEAAYKTEIETLKFVGEGSKVEKYKSIICILHQEEWACYGGGYDFECPALWINPSTCKPVGSAVAHEIGHSFQYMCYGDLGGGAGFHYTDGNGSGFWEQTAQWQSLQDYPGEKWSQSWFNFQYTHNYAMTHEWMRYQSYWWHYYLTEKYGIDIVSRIWRHDAGAPKKSSSTNKNSEALDANEVFMDLMEIDSEELFRLYFDYAMKMATLDIDVDGIKTEGASRIGTYAFNYVPLGGTKHQVAYSSCPQSTGFNIIPLEVPADGGEVSTEFTSLKSPAKLAEGDPKLYYSGDSKYESTTATIYNFNSRYNAQRGFRLGYVALLSDGTRQYLYEDKLYCADDTKSGEKTVTVSATVPEGTSQLFLVVVPAPREYIRHVWDDNIANDDQWPYTVEFTNTNIVNAPIPPTINEALPVTDATITYDVQLPRTTGDDYTPVTVTVAGQASAALGTAFQMQPSELSSHLVAWTSTAPVEGKMKFYAVNPTTGDIVNQGNTANGYGHWFSASGVRTDWGNGTLYSELDATKLTFNVGPKPGALTVGSTYTIAQAFRYKKDGKQATVKFVFRVTGIASGSAGSYKLASVEQSPLIEEILTGISAPASTLTVQPGTGTYNLAGQRVGADYKGVVIRDGRKCLQK